MREDMKGMGLPCGWHTFGAMRGAILNLLTAFPKSRAGTTAVEFGLLALPFIGLTGATLEAGITYFGQEILQQAVTDASRQIYTGKFQADNVATTDTTALINKFRSAICMPNGRPLTATFNCANLRISIAKATSFGSAAPAEATSTNPTTGVSDWNPNFASYTCARANDVMVVQAVVDVPVYFPLLGSAYATLPNNRRLLQAAAVFQVEPFNSTAACASAS
jgi:Flp pilus assembly protein TadG